MTNTRSTGMTRRQMVALSATGAACALAAGKAGAAWASEAGDKGAAKLSFTPGTYTGHGTGRGGDITVNMEFTADAVKSVEVASHSETNYISDAAIERIPAAIVEHQSIGVDAVTSATLTSMGIIAAVRDCAEQAGADMDAFDVPVETPKSTDVVELTCDVAVAGAGAAGLAAAVAAAEAGAEKVIVLEKASNVGGNALVSGGWLEYIYAPESMRQQMTDGLSELFASIIQEARDGGAPDEFVNAVQADYDAYYAEGKTTVYDSTGFYSLELCSLESGGGFSNIAPDTPVNDPDAPGPLLNDWFTEMGIVWKEPLIGIVGYAWPHWSGVKDAKNGEGYFDLLTGEIAKKGYPVQILTLTPATELIMDGDAVVGIRGVGEDGTTYDVRASRGVLLATGGFSGNPDMLKRYNTTWDWTDDTIIPTTNAYGHTGDGIVMGMDAGGYVSAMENPMVFPMADRKNYSTETIVGNSSVMLLVNEEGKRFVNESASRYTITAALLEQPGQDCYGISDANNCLITDGRNVSGSEVQPLLDNGQLFKADSIKKLAGLIGVDADTLQATVDAYNELCEGKGADAEFGRTTFTEECLIKEPPFYASPRTWAAHITVGGLVCDSDGRVLTESGEPVNGLWCAGEVAVGQCGIGVFGNGLVAARAMMA